MKLAWLTDTHFDRAVPSAPEDLVAEARAGGAEGLIHTGDIATGDTVAQALVRLAAPGWPVHFALGNHDFWSSSFARVAEDLRIEGLRGDGREGPPVHHHGRTAVVAVDGWYDGMAGHGYGSRLSMNDWALVEELRSLDRATLFRVFAERGAAAAAAMTTGVERAIREGARHVVVVTHVPPFREAALHEGKPSNDNYAPFFVCVQAGSALTALARENPTRTLTVLCGHSHECALYAPEPNLVVHTGHALYGYPEVAGWVDLDDDDAPRVTMGRVSPCRLP